MQRYLEKDPLDDRGITLEELVRNYIGVPNTNDTILSQVEYMKERIDEELARQISWDEGD